MTNPETPPIFNIDDLGDPVERGSAPTFDLDAEFKRYQDRERALLNLISEETIARKIAAAKIAKARDELRMVRRLLSATKPRKPKV